MDLIGNQDFLNSNRLLKFSEFFVWRARDKDLHDLISSTIYHAENTFLIIGTYPLT